MSAQLRCYAPEPVDETWGRLRHLGARRERLLTELIAQVQQMRDLLECVWPAALQAANYPFRSRTWAATMSIILERDGGDFARTRRLGLERLENLVRKEVTRWGAVRATLRITRNLFAALDDQAGVIGHRRGALERVAFVLDDWFQTRRRRVDVEERMTAVLDDLGLTQLVTSIPGLSAVGAAAILAETGDPHRFASARAVVKHAGLAPRERSSGTFVGRTRVTGQGRPSLRLAAWRGIWGTLRSNPVHAARYTYLTSRQHNRLKPTQAQAAVAAALLRQLHAVIVTGRPWDPEIATHGSRRRPLEVAA